MRKLVLFCFYLFLNLNLVLSQDKYADIGSKDYANSYNELVTPPIFNLTELYLPNTNNIRAIFEKKNESDTEKDLYEELSLLKDKYKQFMNDFSRLEETSRKRINLDKFYWRVESDQDKKDFIYTLSGKGKWEEVSIPHYGPPLGKKVTYYRKEIELDTILPSDESLILCFKGVDYKANVFFNGVFLGSHEGFFAPFEFDVSQHIKYGKNVILVKVENDYSMLGGINEYGQSVKGDKIYAASGLGYDDPEEGWHLCPAGMGIHQECFLEYRKSCYLNDIFVRPILSDSIAEAWIEVTNLDEKMENLYLSLSIYGKNFVDTIVEDVKYYPSTVLIPGVGDFEKEDDWKNKTLMMGNGPNYLRIPIKMKNVRLWTPDTPWLYNIHVKLYDSNNKLQDVQSRHFGMRSFTMDTVSVPKGNMFLNGNKIRLRGANTMGNFQQCVFKKDTAQLINDILLAKLCNINFIRFTQSPVQTEVYNYCDMLGMLNQTDLPLFGSVRYNQFSEVLKQGGEMERHIRKHPSCILISYINERFPNGEGSPQRCISNKNDYYKLFSSLDNIILFNNPDRVIKAGDGDYNPPSPGLPDNHCYNIWYNGHAIGLGELYKGQWLKIKPNWQYACGEFGAEGLDNINTIYKYYPENWLPTNNEVWNPFVISKSQLAQFHYMFYKTPKNLDEWVNESQRYQAEAIKFITECFRRDSRMVSFAVHLFIDAWPAGWMKAIMDVDRHPKKAYFAYKRALQPLMASIRSDRRTFYSGENTSFELWISNDYNSIFKDYILKYQIEDGNDVIFSNEVLANIECNKSTFQGFLNYKIPYVEKRKVFTLRISLENNKGESIYQNSFDFEVFPNNIQIESKIFVIGEKDNNLNKLIKKANIELTNNYIESDVILVNNYSIYKQDEKFWNDMVYKGKKMIFLNLESGKYEIGGTRLDIFKTTMRDFYFISPNLNHLLLRDFKFNDFRCWYNDMTQSIQPILSNVVVAENWNSILESGMTDKHNGYKVVKAAGELNYGKGCFRFSEVKLANFILYNPSAKIFLKRLLED